ncbi:hypothetical protein [Fodinicola acaciae]|uniref:hypothetical protein n=1 Tax=Fodinicola acaciae TaxID=2681555 RepID=UPI0013CF7B18|nr:hypothetical protein [Fodinicola acaciae]
MQVLFDYLLLRMVYVGAVAVGLIILGFVAMVILKKLELWDRVRAFLEPILRQKLKERGGIASVIEQRIGEKK